MTIPSKNLFCRHYDLSRLETTHVDRVFTVSCLHKAWMGFTDITKKLRSKFYGLPMNPCEKINTICFSHLSFLESEIENRIDLLKDSVLDENRFKKITRDIKTEIFEFQEVQEQFGNRINNLAKELSALATEQPLAVPVPPIPNSSSSLSLSASRTTAVSVPALSLPKTSKDQRCDSPLPARMTRPKENPTPPGMEPSSSPSKVLSGKRPVKVKEHEEFYV